MNIILLSGGSGTRLWPLSNEVRSKQFLRIFRNEDGGRESMVQRVYRMIRKNHPAVGITIATSEKQTEAIRAQLGGNVSVSIEPCRRNTFPAIALACAYLHDKLGVSEEDFTVVCPIDCLVEESFFQAFGRLEKRALESGENLVLMGMKPTCPSEKYGYILPRMDGESASVEAFSEKPCKEKAEALIKRGALWNGGVFAFRLGYVLDRAKELLGTASYESLFDQYASLPKISFDYAVSEHEEKLGVVRYDGLWEDIGTWDTLTAAMSEQTLGDVVSDRCSNVYAINELGIPLVTYAVSDVVVAASPDGILVSGLSESAGIKSCVEGLGKRPMCEEKEWGHYTVLDYSTSADGTGSLTKQIVIASGRHISYHTHTNRSEHWTVTAGQGRIIIEGVANAVRPGDSYSVKPGVKHAIYAETELRLIEVQLGEDLSEDDINRLDWDWSTYG
ncbi:MAG: cupin domain-containing protein [Lachnospiraceae bacterium]|nr:cupin domain-containing protein [Lachnospiraceae bacterium]